MRYVAIMYFNGDGVGQSHRNSYKWFLRAHEAPPPYNWSKPDEESAFYLGIMNLWGLGIERSRPRAEHYLARSGFWGESRLE